MVGPVDDGLEGVAVIDDTKRAVRLTVGVEACGGNPHGQSRLPWPSRPAGGQAGQSRG